MAQNSGRRNGPWNPPGAELGGFGEGFGTGFNLYGPAGRQMGLPATAGHYSDEEIQRIEASLLDNNPYTAEADIEATVQNRVITLAGTVKNARTKRMAEQDAWSIPSVKDVKNEIRTAAREPSRTASQSPPGEAAEAPPAPVVRSDENLQSSIYDALDDDPAIPADIDISVNVNDGRATLQGRVPNKQVKRAAGHDAWNTPGIRDVYNELNVEGRADRARSAANRAGDLEVERRAAKK